MSKMDIFNLIAGICSIMSFLIAIFVTTKVISIEKRQIINGMQETTGENSPVINAQGNSEYNNQSGNVVHNGNIVGRDKNAW